MTRTFNEFAHSQNNFDESFWSSISSSEHKSKYKDDPMYGSAFQHILSRFLRQGMEQHVAVQAADQEIEKRSKTPALDWEMKRMSAVRDKDTGLSPVTEPAQQQEPQGRLKWANKERIKQGNVTRQDLK